MSESKHIFCSINTPIISETFKGADMIILPSSEGEIGILYGHMPLIAELKNGLVRLITNGELIEELIIDKGIANINNYRVDIICNHYHKNHVGFVKVSS